MRRTTLLGAVTPIVVLGILAWTQAALLAQSPKAPTPSAIPAQVQPEVAPFGSDGSVPGTVVPQAQPFARSDTFEPLDANPVRQRFLELSKKKAQALNEEELKREVESMETEVRELEAWTKADEALRLLREVAEKHRNTKAAEAASAAIQVLESRRNAVTTRTLGPMPEPIRDMRLQKEFRPAKEPDSPRVDKKGAQAEPFESAPTNRPIEIRK